jgi:hypothetical protein
MPKEKSDYCKEVIAMANEELMDKKLTEDELEMVAGGGTYHMLRYRKREDGKYDAESISFTGDEKAWNAFKQGKPVKNLNVKITSTFSKGIRPDMINKYLDRYRKKGYVIQVGK